MQISGMARRALAPLLAVVCIVASAYVMVPFAAGLAGSGYEGLDRSPYGAPKRPMVYRVLMPAVAKAVIAVIPQAIEKPVTAHLIAWRDSDGGRALVKNWFKRPPPLADDSIFESAVVLFICYLALLAFLWMLYMLALEVFPDSTAYALFAPLLALQQLPVMVINNAYIWDFTELFFSCALMFLLLRHRVAWYVAVFALATLNKETSVFMLLYFAAWGLRRVQMNTYLALMAAQCAIYGAIKGAVTLYYANVPGELIGPHVSIAGNLHYLWEYGDWKFILLAFALMAYRWKDKPPVLKAALPMVAAHWLVYIVLCIPGEYRDLYWSLPVMLLMITHSLVAGVEIEKHPVFSR